MLARAMAEAKLGVSVSSQVTLIEADLLNGSFQTIPMRFSVLGHLRAKFRFELDLARMQIELIS